MKKHIVKLPFSKLYSRTSKTPNPRLLKKPYKKHERFETIPYFASFAIVSSSCAPVKMGGEGQVTPDEVGMHAPPVKRHGLGEGNFSARRNMIHKRKNSKMETTTQPRGRALPSECTQQKMTCRKPRKHTSHLVFRSFLTCFTHGSCLAQLPTLLDMSEFGEGRRPPPLTAVLRSCHTSCRGLQWGDVLAWPPALRWVFP